MSLYVVDNENSIVHIFRIGIYKYKISLVDNVFEINKSFFWLIKSNIFIEIDSFKYNEGDVCFYLYNKKQRVSVVLTNDPEIDCVDISNDTGKLFEFFKKFIANSL